MKIGILADIHERVDHLQAALNVFQDSHVDQIIVLGDVFDSGKCIDQTVELLREANAVGVWGNHDIGLSESPDARITDRYSAAVIEYFGTLTAQYELDDVLVCHGMPTWDPRDPAIYYLGKLPWERNNLQPVFTTFSHRIFLIGHFHRWHLSTAGRSTEWDGTQPIVFDPTERYFVIVNAVLDGWCAILDTETNEFTPRFVG